MFASIAAFACGVALHLQQRELPAPWVHALLIAVACGALWLAWRTARRAGRRVGGWRLALVCAAALALGFAWPGLRAGAQLADALDPALEGVDLRVSGVVAAMPQQGGDSLRFRLEVHEARRAANATAVRLPPLIQLTWRAPAGALATPLRAGDLWDFTVRLRAPHGQMNPHGFDYELWLWGQGVQATGYVRDLGPGERPRLVRPASSRPWSHPVERARQTVRDAIVVRVPDARQAGVVAALVTGDQQAVDRADWDLFRVTGVAHLMSISGLHVTMFAWLAALLLQAGWSRSVLWLGRIAGPLAWQPPQWWPAQHVAALGGMLGALAYAVFSGWGVPAQRTVWMVGTVALLRLSGRHWPARMTWALAFGVVIALDPWAMLQPGFWLSFVAVGVLFASDGTSRTRHEAPATGLRARVLALLREQAVVTIALTPLTLLLFQQVSLVGLLANLLAIPWVTLVVTPLSMLGVLAAPLWGLAAASVGLLMDLLGAMARWPSASLSAVAPPLWTAVLGVGGGVLAVMRLPPPSRLAGLVLTLPVLLWRPAPVPLGQFELTAADVGQGNAVIVRTQSHAMLYDAGPRHGPDSDAGHRTLVPLLRAWGVSPDLLMLSHRDSDHTGGARAVLDAHPRAALTGSLEDGHPLRLIRPASPCLAGQQWTWDGVRFEVLHPMAGQQTATARPNTLSCVLRISNGRQAALLAGDIEAAQEARLLSGGDNAGLRADYLLVPHHGSNTSSTHAFIQAVAPRLAVVQSGYRNRFGHPAPRVVLRYERAGARLVNTVNCGAAIWRSDRPGSPRCWRDEARRYWHHRMTVPQGEPDDAPAQP